MIAIGKQAAAIFVDKSSPEHWVVRDPEGNFWILPPIDEPWERREPFVRTEDSELVPIPGHYRYTLGLPF